MYVYLDKDPWLSDRNLTVPSNEKKKDVADHSQDLIVSVLLLYRIPHTYAYKYRTQRIQVLRP